MSPHQEKHIDCIIKKTKRITNKPTTNRGKKKKTIKEGKKARTEEEEGKGGRKNGEGEVTVVEGRRREMEKK